MARGELLVLARASQPSLARQLGEERKRVLKICVSKLQTIQDPEAFLCRSVLINNTLRQIQEQHREGQRRARSKRARQVVEEEEEEEEVEVGQGRPKRLCLEARPLGPALPVEELTDCPRSREFYEVGIYKEDVLQKEKEEEADTEDEEAEEEEDTEEEEEEEESFERPLAENPMLGSIEISVVSSGFCPSSSEEEERLQSSSPEVSEDDSSSSSCEDSSMYHCPYSLLGELGQQPALQCGL